MEFNQILMIIFFITIIVVIFYFLMSPYQKCLRNVDEKIEIAINKLATETDINERENIELEQEKLAYQIQFGCFEKTSW